MDGILNWMKEFLIIYLILNILTNLTALDQYKKHLHFFSGVVLMLVLLTPVLRLTGKEGKLEALISSKVFWEKLDSARQDTKKLEFIRNSHYIARYEQAIAREMRQQAQQQDIVLRQVQVRLTDDYEIRRVTIWPEFSSDAQQEGEKKALIQFLTQTYGLEESRIFIQQ